MYFYKKKEPQAINEDKIIMNKNPFFKKKIGNEIKELDAYDILGIQQNSTENEIKKAYKDLSLVHHPDKGGDIELFSIINKAYRTALMVSKAVKPQSKIEHHELKKNSKTLVYSANKHNVNLEGKNFNLNKFNEVYDNNRLDNPYDKGYEKWDIELVNENPNIKKNISQDTFNNEFNKTKTINNYNQQIMKIEEPTANISGNLGFSELGVDNVDTFTKSEQDTTNGINFTDYKDAYTKDSKLINTEQVEINKPKSLNELKINRENINYNMSEEENKQNELRKQQQAEEELKRLQTVNLFDEMALEHYNKVNQLMLGNK